MANDFVHFFSHRAGEFLDEDWHCLTELLAKHESKTPQQISEEIKGQIEERKCPGSRHPFETWGSPELLARIKTAQAAKTNAQA
jgi:hypothetical protein